MEAMIEFIKNNKILISGKSHPCATQEVESKWDELTILLNNIEGGSRKDKKQWKCFFSEWKSKTRKKARLNKERLVATGGGAYTSHDLSDLENKIMLLLGWITVVGDDYVPEEIDPSGPISSTEVLFPNNLEGLLQPGEYEIDQLGTGELVYSVQENEEDNQSLPEPSVIQTNQTNATNSNITLSSGTVPRFSLNKKKRTLKQKQSNLEKSTEMYSKSIMVMANSIDNMAKSISELAQSLISISQAILTHKD
ncbi:hypothetical protein FQR65_LT16940 [Abscondita terminalis]|nr:hypothetical protein FQR65_LT16940 [Abscondita terminalis]